MTSIKSVKNQAGLLLKNRERELEELCLKIHSSPEAGLDEHKASSWLCNFLKQNGFAVKHGIGELPTAFTACYGKGKPRIALLAEYDALPELGHACGHNIIGVAAAGAAIASTAAVDCYGGTVMVIGSPSEEFHSGKELLIREGIFEEVDAALMVHPGDRNITAIRTLACITLNVEFNGRQAHASANPEEGVNALDAMLLSFNAINSLRQHILDSARIHGIITNGGQAPNIVPGYSAGMFMARARDTGYLETLKAKMIDCFKGAALSTGATLKYRWADAYCKPMKNNPTLSTLFRENMSSTGRFMDADIKNFASTDMGNVSQIIPAIHPIIAIAPEGTSLHTADFSKAAASGQGIKGMLDGAAAMAFTVADILGNADIFKRIIDDFQQSRE